MYQIRLFCMILMFIINTKIRKLFFVFYFSMNFIFLENEIKVCSKFYKKIYFCNLESFCDDMYDDCIYQILLVFSNAFSSKFYFIHQISSFCIISIFSMNTKINFCILLFNEFYVFAK